MNEFNFDEFQPGSEGYVEIVDFNRQIERAKDDIKYLNKYCDEWTSFGYMGSDARDEKCTWDDMELVVYTTRVTELHRRNVLYNLPSELYHTDYSENLEVKWIGAGFHSYVFQDFSNIVKLFSPSRLLLSRHLCGNPEIRTKIIKHILKTKLSSRILRKAREMVKENSKICSLGSQQRGKDTITHFDSNTGLVKYDGNKERGMKEGPIRALQNAVIRDELEICAKSPSEIEGIINLPINIPDRIEAHKKFRTVDTSIDELVNIYKESIEIQNQCENMSIQKIDEDRYQTEFHFDPEIFRRIRSCSDRYKQTLIQQL